MNDYAHSVERATVEDPRNALIYALRQQVSEQQAQINSQQLKEGELQEQNKRLREYAGEVETAFEKLQKNFYTLLNIIRQGGDTPPEYREWISSLAANGPLTPPPAAPSSAPAGAPGNYSSWSPFDPAIPSNIAVTPPYASGEDGWNTPLESVSSLSARSMPWQQETTPMGSDNGFSRNQPSDAAGKKPQQQMTYAEKKLKRDEFLATIENLKLQSCTFAPKINKLSAQLAAARSPSTASRAQTQPNSASTDTKSVSSTPTTRASQKSSEVRGGFAPQLEAMGRAGGEGKGEEVDVVTRLLDKGKLIQQKREALKADLEEKEQEHATFQPAVNLHTFPPSAGVGSVFDRLHRHAEEGKERLGAMQKEALESELQAMHDPNQPPLSPKSIGRESSAGSHISLSKRLRDRGRASRGSSRRSSMGSFRSSRSFSSSPPRSLSRRPIAYVDMDAQLTLPQPEADDVARLDSAGHTVDTFDSGPLSGGSGGSGGITQSEGNLGSTFGRRSSYTSGTLSVTSVGRSMPLPRSAMSGRSSALSRRSSLRSGSRSVSPKSARSVTWSEATESCAGWSLTSSRIGSPGGLLRSNVGIGVAFLARRRGGYLVDDITPGGPADRTGEIRRGDSLVAVDGVLVERILPNQLPQMLLGREGTSVKLTLSRGLSSNTFAVRIVRGLPLPVSDLTPPDELPPPPILTPAPGTSPANRNSPRSHRPPGLALPIPAASNPPKLVPKLSLPGKASRSLSPVPAGARASAPNARSGAASARNPNPASPPAHPKPPVNAAAVSKTPPSKPSQASSAPTAKRPATASGSSATPLSARRRGADPGRRDWERPWRTTPPAAKKGSGREPAAGREGDRQGEDGDGSWASGSGLVRQLSDPPEVVGAPEEESEVETPREERRGARRDAGDSSLKGQAMAGRDGRTPGMRPRGGAAAQMRKVGVSR